MSHGIEEPQIEQSIHSEPDVPLFDMDSAAQATTEGPGQPQNAELDVPSVPQVAPAPENTHGNRRGGVRGFIASAVLAAVAVAGIGYEVSSDHESNPGAKTPAATSTKSGEKPSAQPVKKPEQNGSSQVSTSHEILQSVKSPVSGESIQALIDPTQVKTLETQFPAQFATMLAREVPNFKERVAGQSVEGLAGMQSDMKAVFTAQNRSNARIYMPTFTKNDVKGDAFGLFAANSADSYINAAITTFDPNQADGASLSEKISGLAFTDNNGGTEAQAALKQEEIYATNGFKAYDKVSDPQVVDVYENPKTGVVSFAVYFVSTSTNNPNPLNNLNWYTVVPLPKGALNSHNQPAGEGTDFITPITTTSVWQ